MRDSVKCEDSGEAKDKKEEVEAYEKVENLTSSFSEFLLEETTRREQRPSSASASVRVHHSC